MLFHLIARSFSFPAEPQRECRDDDPPGGFEHRHP